MPHMSRLKAFVSVFGLLPVLSLSVPAGRAASPAKGAGDAAQLPGIDG